MVAGPVDSLVVLDVLGVPIAVSPNLARSVAHLRRSTGSAEHVIDDPDPYRGLPELTRVAAEHSPLLCMHAGVVAARDGLLAVPGQSGLGKTTLVASLVQRGFGYVSDEALAVDVVTGLVEPFPRPLGLGADVWPLLGLGAHTEPPLPGAEKLIPPEVFGAVATRPGRVSDIVLARRMAGPTELVRTARGQAVSELLRRSFNHYRAPEASFRAVVEMVRNARVWAARYEMATEFATVLADQLSPTIAR